MIIINKYFFAGVAITGSFSLAYFVFPSIFSISYKLAVLPGAGISAEGGFAVPVKKIISHLTTPSQVKAIYMTNWVAGDKKLRSSLVKIADDTEINSIVIDIKDYTGRIGFEVSDPLLKELGAYERRIADIKEFIEELHKKNIYVIGRISVFQDKYLVGRRPDLAVRRKSDGGVWKDFKNISWLDPGSKEVWGYIAALAKESYGVGFDDLNFDYIRFPSDGNMSDIAFPVSAKRNKVEVLSEFFAYLDSQLADISIPISADVFGMVATNYDDLNIGQVLEQIAPHFDYIAPMVYPSHYPPTFQGFKNPAAHPYEIVLYSMSKAVERLIAASSTPASPTSQGGPSKLRPWIQDFDLGATYDAEKVRAEIQAVYDSGLTSWMSWDAGNKYTRDAYKTVDNEAR